MLAGNFDIGINIVANLDLAISEPKFYAYIYLHSFVPSISPIATCLWGFGCCGCYFNSFLPFFFSLYCNFQPLLHGSFGHLSSERPNMQRKLIVIIRPK